MKSIAAIRLSLVVVLVIGAADRGAAQGRESAGRVPLNLDLQSASRSMEAGDPQTALRLFGQARSTARAAGATVVEVEAAIGVASAAEAWLQIEPDRRDLIGVVRDAYEAVIRAGSKEQRIMATNNLSVLLLNEGQSERAIELLRELKPADLSAQQYPVHLYNLGIAYEHIGNLPVALDHYVSAAVASPRYERAIRGAFRIFGKQGPSSAQRLSDLALVWIKNGNGLTVLNSLRPLIESWAGERSVELLLKPLVAAWLALGLTPEAFDNSEAAFFQRLMNRQNTHLNVLLWEIERAPRGIFRLSTAEDEFRRWLTDRSAADQFSGLLKNLGHYYEHAGKPGAALTMYQGAHDVKPDADDLIPYIDAMAAKIPPVVRQPANLPNSRAATIAEQLASQSNLSIVSHLVRLTPEYQATLDGAGAFTFFAPSDLSFRTERINFLYGDQEARMRFLSDHTVIAVLRPGSEKVTKAKMMDGITQELRWGDPPRIGEANIVLNPKGTPIECSNGVLYITDRSLLPGPLTAFGSSPQPFLKDFLAAIDRRDADEINNYVSPKERNSVLKEVPSRSYRSYGLYYERGIPQQISSPNGTLLFRVTSGTTRIEMMSETVELKSFQGRWWVLNYHATSRLF